MGRSVSYPNDCTAVCFRNVSGFGYDHDDDGNPIEGSYDEFVGSEEWDDFKDWIVETAKSNWKTIEEADKWLDREDHAIAENDFAYIGVSEYCGLCSVWLLSKGEDLRNSGYSDDAALANLADNWCNTIEAKFKKLFGEYNLIARASNGEAFYEKAGE